MRSVPERQFLIGQRRCHTKVALESSPREEEREKSLGKGS